MAKKLQNLSLPSAPHEETMDEYKARIVRLDPGATCLADLVQDANWAVTVPNGRYRAVPLYVPSDLRSDHPMHRAAALAATLHFGRSIGVGAVSDDEPLPVVQLAMQRAVDAAFERDDIPTLVIKALDNAVVEANDAEQINVPSPMMVSYAERFKNVLSVVLPARTTARLVPNGPRWSDHLLASMTDIITYVDNSKAKKKTEATGGTKGRKAAPASFLAESEEEEGSEAAE